MSGYTEAHIGPNIIEDLYLLALKRGVRLLHIEALSWSSAHQTDGAIPRFALSRISDQPDLEAAAATLVEAGLWETTSTGWSIKIFASTQLSKASVEREQAMAKARWEKHRDGLKQSQDHRAATESQTVDQRAADAQPPTAQRAATALATGRRKDGKEGRTQRSSFPSVGTGAERGSASPGGASAASTPAKPEQRELRPPDPPPPMQMPPPPPVVLDELTQDQIYSYAARPLVVADGAKGPADIPALIRTTIKDLVDRYGPTDVERAFRVSLDLNEPAGMKRMASAYRLGVQVLEERERQRTKNSDAGAEEARA